MSYRLLCMDKLSQCNAFTSIIVQVSGVCYLVCEIVESLCVSVPLDPAEVLYYSLYCFGQTLGIRHHLVHIHIHIQLRRRTEFLMQSSPEG